jgi:Fe2+ transport system protein FeoA
VKASSHRKLSDSREGERVTVQGVSDDDPVKLRELQRRGLVPGTKLVVLAASEFEGPIEVKLRGRRESVPLGLARAVFVAETR